jgi:hypothetical protein
LTYTLEMQIDRHAPHRLLTQIKTGSPG